MDKEIKEKLENENISFDEFYNFLHEKDVGYWDNVNSKEIIQKYCYEKMKEGIHIGHILTEMEVNQSKTEVYCMWLGNSMRKPEPINTKKELVIALGLIVLERYSCLLSREVGFRMSVEAENEKQAIAMFHRDLDDGKHELVDQESIDKQEILWVKKK